MNNVRAAVMFLGAVVASMAAVALIDRVTGNKLSDSINAIRGTGAASVPASTSPSTSQLF